MNHINISKNTAVTKVVNKGEERTKSQEGKGINKSELELKCLEKETKLIIENALKKIKATIESSLPSELKVRIIKQLSYDCLEEAERNIRDTISPVISNPSFVETSTGLILGGTTIKRLPNQK